MTRTSNPRTLALVEIGLTAIAFCLLSARTFAAAGDENWEARFGSPGIGGVFLPSVNAVAASGIDVYVGGQFTGIGGVRATNIAKWNGTAWSALGSGLGTSINGVQAIAVMGTNVYVGGNFTNAGDVSVNYVARWDGSLWSPLGGGMDYTVFALATDGTNLYAGGSFGTAGGPGANANAVARWNGTQWSPLSGPLGNGAGGAVFAITVSGSDVYVGGNFASVGLTLGVNNGINARGVARWSGAQWYPLGTGINGFDYRAQALAVSGTDLYVGGHFTSAGGIATKGIALWTGSGWVSLGGISGNYEEVEGLAVNAGKVYAIGTFSTAGGVSANNVARWDGANWSPLGSGIGDDIYYGLCGVATSDELYVGGTFDTAGGKPSRFFAGYVFPSAAPPTLTAVSAPGAMVISWPTAASGFSLQSSANFISGSWNNVTNPPVVSGNNNLVTTDTTGAARFFRLMR